VGRTSGSGWVRNVPTSRRFQLVNNRLWKRRTLLRGLTFFRLDGCALLNPFPHQAGIHHCNNFVVG